MPKGKKKTPKAQPAIDQNQTLLKWLTSRKKRQQEQERLKSQAKQKQKDVDIESAKRTKKIKKLKKDKPTQVKLRQKSKRRQNISKQQKEKQISEQAQNENQQPIQQNQDQLTMNKQKIPQSLQKQQINQQEQEQVMIVEDPKVPAKRGRGRKKKSKSTTKAIKKEEKQPLDYHSKYPQLFATEEVSSTQLIFDKYKPEELEKYRKDHQGMMQVQQQVQQYQQYPAEQKHKPVKQPSQPLPDGRRYQVPIKVCTCCNFFGKRHLCAHNLCSKPCPIQHRKTKIRDRYFQRYKHRPKAQEYDDQEQ